MELTDEPLILRRPTSPDEWDAYFDLRWRILRQPWRQPRPANVIRRIIRRFISCYLTLPGRLWPAVDCIWPPWRSAS